MEHEPQPLEDEHDPHGLDADQEQVGQARNAATEQRRRDRERLEGYVEAGVDPDDAEALIDVQHAMRAQRAGTEQADDEPSSSPTPADRSEVVPRPEPRIYVASLSDYNAGVLHGVWIDADQDVEVLAAEVADMIAASPTPGAEESAIHDSEGFFGLRLHEQENLEAVSRLANGLVTHGEAYAVLADYAGTRDLDFLDEAMRSAYRGSWESTEAYLDHVIEEMDVASYIDNAPEPYRSYLTVDRARLARDLGERLMLLEGPAGRWHIFEPGA